MIVLVEVHAMTGLGSGNSPTPIPYFAFVVSDEGSISRSATELRPPPLLYFLVTNMLALGEPLEKRRDHDRTL